MLLKDDTKDKFLDLRNSKYLCTFKINKISINIDKIQSIRSTSIGNLRNNKYLVRINVFSIGWTYKFFLSISSLNQA